METYRELKERQQKEFSEFPIFFAFSDEQFKEGKEKLGVKRDAELCSIGLGGFIRKKDHADYWKLVLRHEKELKEAKNDPEFVYGMFLYELANHEYSITCDESEALMACNVSRSELKENKMYAEMLRKAEEACIESAVW